MAEQGTSPKDAQQALLELEQRRRQVRDTASPRWWIPLGFVALAATGLGMDLFPRYESGFSWLLVLVVGFTLVAQRSGPIGSALGFRVAPDPRAMRAGGRRQVLALLASVVLLSLIVVLVHRYDVPWPNTVIYGSAAVMLVVLSLVRRPARVRPEAGDVD